MFLNVTYFRIYHCTLGRFSINLRRSMACYHLDSLFGKFNHQLLLTYSNPSEMHVESTEIYQTPWRTCDRGVNLEAKEICCFTLSSSCGVGGVGGVYMRGA